MAQEFQVDIKVQIVGTIFPFPTNDWTTLDI